MKNKKRVLSVIIVVSVFLIAASFAVYSYYFAHESVTNNFEPANVMCTVEEEFDGTEKTSVKIQNTGNIDEYLRLRIVSYWENADGEIVGKPSEFPTIGYDTDNWIYDSTEKTYYYTSKVTPGEKTEELLTSPITFAADAEYYGETVKQVIVIIPEAVQAAPDNAVHAMWPYVTASNGQLTH